MDINWLGHACFRIKGKQAAIVTDPYSPKLGYSLGKPTANIVTVSHQHEGHSYVKGVEGNPRPVTGPGEYEIGGVLIIGISTYHDDAKGEKRGKNTAYLMEIDDISVCHLGDLGHLLTSEEVEEIGDVDILLIPVGGVSTVNAPTAAQIIRQLEPRIVIPMHYRTPALKWELDPVDKFLKEMGVNQASPQPKLSISRSNLPENPQVFLLSYQ